MPEPMSAILLRAISLFPLRSNSSNDAQAPLNDATA
ncbi:hypothetical protein RHECNPAF_750057 [Rhizobium etli CNPAF512]|nr:hypothetical protein RHECNPAF_750057 [Rhizobium etli CNPAF512]